MGIRVAINGFGRIGRLALRIALEGTGPTARGKDRGRLEVVHVNEPNCDVETAAHLLMFDSIHGRLRRDVRTHEAAIVIDRQSIGYTSAAAPQALDWSALGIDLVLECSGKFKTPEKLVTYFERGVRKVVVSAPVKGADLNIVMGVNDNLYDHSKHRLVTAASCTTNCLAPIVSVLQKGIGIKHGMITTVHNVTNSQAVIDKPTKDLRRSRSAVLNLIPTSTGSATAIGLIFPELRGRLDGIAVRVPILNASITDCVFEVERQTAADEVNALMKKAASGPLRGILGYEERALVSSDFRGDTHSSIVDALSTMVTNRTQVKVLAWYDNEVGYANRLCELAAMIASGMQGTKSRNTTVESGTTTDG